MTQSNISIIKRLFIFLLLALPVSLLAQKGDTTSLEGFISTNKTLSSNKVYIIKHNVKVGENATLTVEKNTTVLFDFNTTLVVEGGLQLKGAPDQFIQFLSRDPDNPGYGLLIRGTNGADIDVRYTMFTGLSNPLKFDTEWFRKNVVFQKNVFKESFTGESIIIFTNPNLSYDIGDNAKINLDFSDNTFTQNWGSIFIENLQDNILQLKFHDNLITNNVVYSAETGVPSNTPVFGIYDNTPSKYEASISGNSVYSNYQINAATDTIIREVSFGIKGDGEVFEIPNNFFRSDNLHYISSTFDHFYQNSDLPLLKPDPILTEPKETLQPHIWKAVIDNKQVQNYGKLPAVGRRDIPFEVHFNKPVSEFGETQLESMVYDTANNELVIDPINIADSKWSSDKKVFYFTVSNANFLRNELGYIIIKNFKDNEGFIVPDFTIGQKNAINRYRKLEGVYVKSGDIISGKEGVDVDIERGSFLPGKEEVKTLEALTDLGDISYLGPYQSLAKTWEVGLLFGTSNYTGSLTKKLAERDEYHVSFGIFGQYNAHQWFSLRAMLWYGKISGEDYTDPDGGNRERLANFKNHIFEGSLTFHWHLLKYGTQRGERFTPSIFAGIGLFRNVPMSRIFLHLDRTGEPVWLTWKDGAINTTGEGKEVWVPVRGVGTEGQTTGLEEDPEANSNSEYADLFKGRKPPKQYKKVQVSFPIGIELNWFIYNSWNIGLQVGYRFTSTRYLDDVGGYYFDRINDHQAIVNANQDGNGNSTIKAKAGKEKITLPNQITFEDDQGTVETHSTAALLANPSLVNANIDNSQLNRETNYAYEYPDARRAPKNVDNADSYFFFGVKVTKILKRKRDREEKDEVSIIKDSDNDGLSDKTEKKMKLDPKNPDTDGDGLNDGLEVNKFNTDPLKADSDEDGVLDGVDDCPGTPGKVEYKGCPEKQE